MNILEAFRIAWTALMTNKLRALLTMLGIIIGVSAVISMLAIGNGLSNGIQSDFTKLGVGVVAEGVPDGIDPVTGEVEF